MLRLLAVLFSIIAIMLMQSCGGGASDTAGALTMTAATSSDNGDGTFTVSTTVTYTPPTGKNAQGVEVTMTVSDGVNTLTGKRTLTSGSNSFLYSIPVAQQPNASSHISIVASIGDMTSSTFVIIPSSTSLAVSPATVSFLASDPANTTKTVTISGGSAPYTVTSSVPLDISATNATNNQVVITLLNANVSSAVTTAVVTVTDSAASPATKIIAVSYFK